MNGGGGFAAGARGQDYGCAAGDNVAGGKDVRFEAASRSQVPLRGGRDTLRHCSGHAFGELSEGSGAPGADDPQDTGYSYSNSDLSRPDWRIMLWRVPRMRGLWSGTGTVMVVPSVCNCMIRWLPRWRTAINPRPSRILQASAPERTRSLPNGHLNLSDEDLAAQPPRNF